jgi:hypothetical protein
MKKKKRLPFEMTEKQKKHIHGHGLFAIKPMQHTSKRPSKLAIAEILREFNEFVPSNFDDYDIR